MTGAIFEEEARQVGIHGFISKPLFKSNLYLGLNRYLQGSSEPEEQIEEEQNFIGKRILLAEDNDLNWEIAEEILTDVGFGGRVGRERPDLCREVQGVRGRVL